MAACVRRESADVRGVNAGERHAATPDVQHTRSRTYPWRGSDLHETGSRMYGTSRCSLSSSTALSVATCAVQFLAYLVVQFAASLVLGTFNETNGLFGTLCSLSSSTVFSLSSSTVRSLSSTMKLVRSSALSQFELGGSEKNRLLLQEQCVCTLMLSWKSSWGEVRPGCLAVHHPERW